MPFRSQAQQRWMFAQHPAMAKRWASETSDFSKLPGHVKKAGGGVQADVRKDEEARFMAWYKKNYASRGINPNPDDPRQRYDYRSAWMHGDDPDPTTWHGSSRWKLEGHPRLIVDGVNTKTGEVVKKADGGLFSLIRKLTTEAPAHARRLERAADEVPHLERQFSNNALEMALRSPRSNVAIIDPSKFEEVAGPLGYNAVPKSIDEPLARILRTPSESIEGRGFADTPLLVMERDRTNPLRWEATGHEGRHRTRAMANEGMDRTLVNLIDRLGPLMWDVSPEGLAANVGATTLRHGPRKPFVNQAIVKPQWQAFDMPQRDWARPDIPWLKAFRSEPFQHGGMVKDDIPDNAVLAGLAALAGATPIGRKLGMRGANALARPFQRAHNAPIVHAESVAREPLSELQSDVRFGMGRSLSGHELANTPTTKGQGAWLSPDTNKMEYNPLYMQEMPRTMGRVSGEREQQKYAALLGALLDQEATTLTRAMKSPFNISEGSDAIFTRPVLREDVKRMGQRLGPGTVVQHRPNAEALLFSLEGEPMEKLARRLRGVLPEPAIRYGVSRPGADRLAVTRSGVDWGPLNPSRESLGVAERSIPRERQEEAFRRALLNPRRSLMGMKELE